MGEATQPQRDGATGLVCRRQASRAVSVDCVNSLVFERIGDVDSEVAEKTVDRIAVHATPEGWLYLDVARALIVEADPEPHVMVPTMLKKSITEVLHRMREGSVLLPASAGGGADTSGCDK